MIFRIFFSKTKFFSILNYKKIFFFLFYFLPPKSVSKAGEKDFDILKAIVVDKLIYSRF